MPSEPVNRTSHCLAATLGDASMSFALTPSMSSLADTIRRHRRASGLSQAALAKRLGISAPSVAQWELGQTRPDLQRLPALAQILGCTIDELIEGAPDPLADRRAELAALANDADESTLNLLIEMAKRLTQPPRGRLGGT